MPTMAENSPHETPAKGFQSAAVSETGEKGRIRAEAFADHCQLASPPCLLQRAGEYIGKAQTFPPCTQILRGVLAPVGKRNVGTAGALSADRPCDLTMPDWINPGNARQ